MGWQIVVVHVMFGCLLVCVSVIFYAASMRSLAIADSGKKHRLAQRLTCLVFGQLCLFAAIILAISGSAFLWGAGIIGQVVVYCMSVGFLVAYLTLPVCYSDITEERPE